MMYKVQFYDTCAEEVSFLNLTEDQFRLLEWLEENRFFDEDCVKIFKVKDIIYEEL